MPTEDLLDVVAEVSGRDVALSGANDGAGGTVVVAGPKPGILKGQHLKRSGSFQKTTRGFV